MFSIINLFKTPAVQKILKSTTVYAGGNFINKGIPFILLPILTRFLTPEDYGALAIFVAILGIIQIIIYMGTSSAVIRAYIDKDAHNFEFPEYVFNAFFINLSVFLIIITCWFLLRNYLGRIIPLSFNYQLLIPLIGFFISAFAISSKLLVMMKRPLPYTAFYSFGTLIEFALSIVFIVVVGLNWKGRVYGITLAKFLLFIIGMGILLKYKYFKISLNILYLKDILKYGFPIVLHSLGFVIIIAIDKFFLNKFFNLSTTGIYSVAYSICSIIAFSAAAFSLAVIPFIYEKLKNATEALKRRLVKFTYLYFILVFMGVTLFIYFIPYVLNILVGKQFLGAKTFIFWLALGFGFHSMYTMVGPYIFYEKKTYILSSLAIVTVILSAVLNYALIKLNGAIGVAQATCLVFLSRFLLVWYFSNKVYPLPWFSFYKTVPVK